MRFSILLCLLFLFACSGNETPKGVFSPQKMSAVLYDIVLADEWVDFSRMQDSSFLIFSKRASIYDSVFRLHQISKGDYQKSISFYQSRPDLLKGVLDSVKARTDTTNTKPIPRPVVKKL